MPANTTAFHTHSRSIFIIRRPKNSHASSRHTWRTKSIIHPSVVCVGLKTISIQFTKKKFSKKNWFFWMRRNRKRTNECRGIERRNVRLPIIPNQSKVLCVRLRLLAALRSFARQMCAVWENFWVLCCSISKGKLMEIGNSSSQRRWKMIWVSLLPFWVSLRLRLSYLVILRPCKRRWGAENDKTLKILCSRGLRGQFTGLFGALFLLQVVLASAKVLEELKTWNYWKFSAPKASQDDLRPLLSLRGI